MATLTECKKSLQELQAIWESGNQESLHFTRYMRQALEELSWELIMQDEDIPVDLEQEFNILEDDVYECFSNAKREACECSMLGYPIGE